MRGLKKKVLVDHEEYMKLLSLKDLNTNIANMHTKPDDELDKIRDQRNILEHDNNISDEQRAHIESYLLRNLNRLQKENNEKVQTFLDFFKNSSEAKKTVDLTSNNIRETPKSSFLADSRQKRLFGNISSNYGEGGEFGDYTDDEYENASYQTTPQAAYTTSRDLKNLNQNSILEIPHDNNIPVPTGFVNMKKRRGVIMMPEEVSPALTRLELTSSRVPTPARVDTPVTEEGLFRRSNMFKRTPPVNAGWKAQTLKLNKSNSSVNKSAKK